jgi:hypothetical protein
MVGVIVSDGEEDARIQRPQRKLKPTAALLETLLPFWRSWWSLKLNESSRESKMAASHQIFKRTNREINPDGGQ